MKIRNGLLAAVSTAAFLFSGSAFAGGVSFTFDDGYESTKSIVLPIMVERRIPGTIFISTGLLDDVGYIKTTDIQAFIDADWEIGAHGINHDNLTELNRSDMRLNLFVPLSELRLETGYDVISMATPYGAFDDDILVSIANYYKAHVNAWSDNDGVNTWGTLNPNNIHRWTIRRTDSAEDVCQKMANLKDDEVFSIVFHDVVKGEPAADREFDISEDTLKAIMDCSLEQKQYYFRIRDIIGE